MQHTPANTAAAHQCCTLEIRTVLLEKYRLQPKQLLTFHNPPPTHHLSNISHAIHLPALYAQPASRDWAPFHKKSAL